MAEATDSQIARPEELRSFIKSVMAASDSPTLIQMVAYHGGWPDLCVRILAALDDDAPANPALDDACRQAGIMPKRLRQRLEPAATALGLLPGGNTHDYFEILGVLPEASTQEIRRAFRRRARRLHPDHGGDTQAFIDLTAAYQTLIDPELRRRYKAGAQQAEVEWYEPPPAPAPAPPRRSRFPLFLVLLVPFLVAVAFALDFVHQESTRPQLPQAKRAAATDDRTPATLGTAPETAMGKTRPSTVGNSGVTPASQPPGAAGKAIIPPDLRPAALTPPHNPNPDPIPAATAHPSRAPQAESFGPLPDERIAPKPGPGHLVLFYSPDVGTDTAHELAGFLQRKGYRLSAPTRKTFAGPSRVRFFHAADRPAADDLRRAARRFQVLQTDSPPTPLQLTDLSRRHPNAPRGLLELWIGSPPAPQATPAARRPAAPAPDERLRAFLQAYCRAYESRDVDQLSAFFHAEAVENGHPIETILPVYKSKMARIERLDYRIELDDYRQEGDRGAYLIVGRFSANVQLPDLQIQESHGQIAMELLARDQSFLIKQLDYYREH